MANDTIARALAIAALDGGGQGAVQSVNGQTGTVVLDAEDVGALPDSTSIPTKTSDLTNDSGFLTEHQSLAAYRTSAAQDIIDAGKQATISDLATIRSGAALGATAIQQHQDISGKQDKLTAGSNITITNNTISATDTTYTAGSGISISNNVISATGGGAEKFICIYDETTFAAAKAAYEAGKELVCQFGDGALISLTCASEAVYLFALVQDGTSVEILLHEDDGWSALEQALQPALTAGTNITIDENNVISASGGGSEPAAYIKDAAVSGNTLTLTKKDDSTVQFTPQGGSSDPFIATYGTTTLADVLAAIAAGKTVYAEYDSQKYALKDYTNSYVTFVHYSDIYSVKFYALRVNASGWNGDAGIPIALQSKLTAGTNITIDANNVISATGGGGSSYTFTNGLTEVDGTVSWDLYSKFKQFGTSCIAIPYGPMLGNHAINSVAICPQNALLKGQNNLFFGTVWTDGAPQCCVMMGKGAHTDSGIQYSNIIGYELKCDSDYQTVLGKYNVSDAGNTYALVLGNGTADNARSNALTVDWSGNLVCNNIPAPPTDDGNYVLKCSIVSGVATYSWVYE